MRYTYKDTLKEAQYIIEGQYNDILAPQKYKYLLEDKEQYLKALKFNQSEVKADI